MIGDLRNAPGGGPMGVSQIEHELGLLRMNDDGTLGLRASVLNLVVVTEEASASEVGSTVSVLAGRYPSRAIVLIADPEAGEARVDVGLSAFCSLRGGSGSQVCAEQITIHAEGEPARHLESLARPLLISDLPVVLWYPGVFSKASPEFPGMARLSDRIVLDSAASGEAAGDCEGSLREIAELLEDPNTPAVGDMQWVALSPWRSLASEMFAPEERAADLAKLSEVEIRHAPDGECRALLFIGWLASVLGWTPESVRRSEEGREIRFSTPSGDTTAKTSPAPPGARFRSILMRAGDEDSPREYEVARSREMTEARTRVCEGDRVVSERTVHLGPTDAASLLGEELRYNGRDAVYEAAVKAAARALSA